jgi:hypothetical protein
VPTLQGDAPHSGAGEECVGRPHPNHQGGCGQEQNKGVKLENEHKYITYSADTDCADGVFAHELITK